MRVALVAWPLAAVVSLSVHAAEMSRDRWAGPYVGVDVGYEWERHTARNINSVTGALQSNGSSSQEGPLGGLHAGYDFQVLHSIVIGVEGGFYRPGIRSRSVSVGNGGASVTESTTDTEWIGMLRGRIGYVLPDIGLPVLVYGSFGLLYNRSTAEQHQLQGTNGGLTAGMTDHLTRNVYRLVGGAGFELAPFENWTIRAEGLYSEGGLGASTYDIRHLRIETKRTRAPIVLVGVNYRF